MTKSDDCCPGCLECLHVFAYAPDYCCHLHFMMDWYEGKVDFMGIKNEFHGDKK